jgi:hypothetical protein
MSTRQQALEAIRAELDAAHRPRAEQLAARREQQACRVQGRDRKAATILDVNCSDTPAGDGNDQSDPSGRA